MALRLQNTENRKLAYKFPPFCQLRALGVRRPKKRGCRNDESGVFAAGFLSFCIYFIKRGKTKMPLFRKIYLARMEEFSPE